LNAESGTFLSAELQNAELGTRSVERKNKTSLCLRFFRSALRVPSSALKNVPRLKSTATTDPATDGAEPWGATGTAHGTGAAIMANEQDMRATTGSAANALLGLFFRSLLKILLRPQ
jgi:hypothetical protein